MEKRIPLPINKNWAVFFLSGWLTFKEAQNIQNNNPRLRTK
jgi:hypothetical protein